MMVKSATVTRTGGATKALTSKRPTKITVRRYAEPDIPEMIARAGEFCAEHPFYKTVPFSAEKAKRVLENNLTNMLFFCDVAEVDGKIVAGLAAALTGYMMSETYFSEDIIGYVIPGARGSTAIDRLVEEYIKWAIERRVHDMRISYTGDKKDGFEVLMKRHGFIPFGSLYVKGNGK